MSFRSTIFAVGLLLCAPVGVLAQSSPLGQALAAGAANDWSRAYAIVGQAPLERDLVTWSRLRDGGGILPEFTAFLRAHPDWPGLDRLRTRGEGVISAATPTSDVLAFFGNDTPQTAQGALWLATALARNGDTTRAAQVLGTAWLTLPMEEDLLNQYLSAYGSVLSPLHPQRAEAMLWRQRSREAERLLPYLSGQALALTRARIATIRGTDDAATLRRAAGDDAGLAFDRFAQLMDKGDSQAAVDLLLQRTGTAASLGKPEAWADLRRTLARAELRAGRPANAYQIAAYHHLSPTEGEAYADLEFFAGFVALRSLKDPATALRHFQALDAAGTTSATDGRAAYWIGRAEQARGQSDAARAAYARAAQHQGSFYGLLATETLGLPLDDAVLGREPFPPFPGAGFLTLDLTRAAFALIEAGDRNGATLFFLKLAETLPRADLGTLGTEMERRNQSYYAIVIAKRAAERGIDLPELYFPLHELARTTLPVDTALAMAIARQESEFNPEAGSSAGAQGLMQLMPATAELVAKKLDLPYTPARLRSDWLYNATLGSRYLADLQERFGNSPVLIAIGYNAGPGRARDWSEQYGDPRDHAVDIVDWIEMIPFRETRRYVQRVTAALPVYRARISGETGAVAMTALLRGEAAGNPGPRLRPGSTASATPSPSGLASSPRPRIRPR